MRRGKRKLPPPSSSSTKQRTLDNLGVLQPFAPGSLFHSSPAHHEDTDELCGPEGELPMKIRTPPVAGIPAAFFSPQRAGSSGLVSRQLSAESSDSLPSFHEGHAVDGGQWFHHAGFISVCGVCGHRPQRPGLFAAYGRRLGH